MTKSSRRLLIVLLITALLVFQSGILPTAIAWAEDEVSVAPIEAAADPETEVQDPAEPPSSEPAQDEPEPADPPINVLVSPVHNLTQDTYFNTISEALAAASEGDTIEVLPGTYDESLVVSVDNLTLQSSNGAAVTTLTADSTPILLVNTDSFQLVGFSFTENDTAIRAEPLNTGTVIIENCRFDSTIMYSAVFAEVSESTVQLRDNVMDSSWRGFYFEEDIDHSSILIDGNTFSQIKERGVNIAKNTQTTTLTITNNSMSGDPLQTNAYGVYTYSGDGDLGIYDDSIVTIADNSFTDFVGESAVYIYYLDIGTEASIVDNIFSNCDASINIDYIGYLETDTGCSVTISGNTISDCDYGIDAYYIYYNSVLDIYGNTLENTYNGVYIGELYESSQVSVNDNSFNDCYNSIYLYYLESESTAIIENNDIFDAFVGFEIDYIGYDGPEDPCYAYIRDNLFERVNYAVDVDEMYYGSLHITGNEMINCGYAVYLDELAYGGDETDVQILNNIVDITEDVDDYSLSYEFSSAVFIAYAERVLQVNNNSISGTPAHPYKYGIYVDDSGNYGEAPVLVYIIGNDVSYCGTGIIMEDIPYYMDGEFEISENTLSHNHTYGIYMRYVGADDTMLDITDNYFLQNETGLYISELYDTDGTNTQVRLFGNSFMANETGAQFNDINFSESGSWLGIQGNDFINNLSGLVFDTLMLNDAEMMLTIAANNFSGNVDYSIQNDSGIEITALNNWWGHPDGPIVTGGLVPVALNGIQTEGDPVSIDVLFDPWIARVEVTPSEASADTGTSQVFTASVYNSDDALVTAAGLEIQFDVTGVNPVSHTVAVGGGYAGFNYIGTQPGLDGVWAMVLFSGESTDLRGSALMTWTGSAIDPEDPEDPEEPLPDTGMDASFLCLGLAAISGGTALKRKRAS